MAAIEVSISPAAPPHGCILKIQTDVLEVNIWLTRVEAQQLSEIRSVTWAERKSLRLGSCAGAAVFWSVKDHELSILVGDDDESWDVALTLPEALVDDILKDASNCLARAS